MLGGLGYLHSTKRGMTRKMAEEIKMRDCRLAKAAKNDSGKLALFRSLGKGLNHF